MGNALIVMTVSEELLGMSLLYVWDKDAKEPTAVPVVQRKQGVWVAGGDRKRAMSEHPEAFMLLPVAPSAVWTPPNEPWREEGLDWHRVPAARIAHRKKMRRSLEKFLNGKMHGLDEMIRTGWMIIERARVKVTDFETVPDMSVGRRQKGRRKEPIALSAGRIDYETRYARAKAKERAEERAVAAPTKRKRGRK